MCILNTQWCSVKYIIFNYNEYNDKISREWQSKCLSDKSTQCPQKMYITFLPILAMVKFYIKFFNYISWPVGICSLGSRQPSTVSDILSYRDRHCRPIHHFISHSIRLHNSCSRRQNMLQENFRRFFYLIYET